MMLRSFNIPRGLVRLSRRIRRDTRGVALVEMALSLPLLMLLCLGMIDISRLVATKIDLEQAAQRTTDFVLAKRPSSSNTTVYVNEAVSASGLPKSGVVVKLYLECDGEVQASFTDICADDETIGRYATVSLTKNVGLDFNWSAFATMFDGKTRSSTVMVVGDSTVRFQ